jgi:DNA helicase II / ATP-dependent DNA helicase PcrA
MHKFIADFHIHSKYSHATSKFMDLPALAQWSQLKGIGVMGTGDFTHPLWQQELLHQLQEAEPGLFVLKAEVAKKVDDLVPAACKNTTRFLLSSEISTVFKRNGRCYRSHSIILAPSFDVVAKITAQLSKIGNIVSDGRPILGLDVKDLLKIILDSSPECMLIPAHIWTPWYGLLGSKSGFNSVNEAFGDLTKHIHAVEKGLSSNFLMNARLTELDQFAILCNSDAHSVQNLGREANVMHTDLSYAGITQALKNNDKKGLYAGIEFFPERGKYFGDGHRACNVYFTPQQTMQNNGVCPSCAKSITVGVLNRVEQLADRSIVQAQNVVRHRYRIVPLLDILSDQLGLPVTSSKLNKIYHHMLACLGNEFFILLHAPIDQIAQACTPGIAQAIAKVRNGEVIITPGYDGVYGRVEL